MRSATTTRRTFLRSGTMAVAGATALTATRSAGAQSEYGGYLDDVGNYDGTVADETGADEVTVAVGADGNGGPFAFDPPAVRVTPGTTIVWEWVQELHNVVDEDGAFESERTDEAGHTFEYTVEEPGDITYYCGPHKQMGMKGVVAVVQGDGGGNGGAAGGDGEATGDDSGANGATEAGGDDGPDGSQDPTDATGDGFGVALPSLLALAFVVPAAYAALANRGGDDADDANGG